jgi:hypothetical protein
MAALQSLGFLLGTSFASGLNLYATVAALGLLHRFDVLQLPPSLEVLSHPAVLTVGIALYVVEFFADKIPYFDTTWDIIHTFIRPPAAAVLAYSAVGDVPEAWSLAAGLLAGGIALTSHGTKATTRAAANVSPEPLSNSVLSLGEDGLALGLTWLAATHPLITGSVVILLLALSTYLLIKLFRFARQLARRLFQGRQALNAAP